jgi:hypothetical protein
VKTNAKFKTACSELGITLPEPTENEYQQHVYQFDGFRVEVWYECLQFVVALGEGEQAKFFVNNPKKSALLISRLLRGAP